MPFNARRATQPPFPITYLTTEAIESIRSDCLADDVEFVLGDLCLRSHSDICCYFEEGGVLPEPEGDISVWCSANIKNAALQRKVKQILTSIYGNLREIHHFLARHMDMTTGLTALLQGSRVELPSPQELPHLLKMLEPLYKASHRRPRQLDPALAPSAEELETEYATKHFATWVQAMLPPLGWGVAMPWETAHGLLVPRKPHAVLRLLTIGGISDTAFACFKLIERAPAWLEVRPIELPGHGYRDVAPDASGVEEVVMGRGAPDAEALRAALDADGSTSDDDGGGSGKSFPAIAALLRESRLRLVEQLVDEIVPVIDDAARSPYALFGFSMGSMIAYLMVREIERRGLRLPIQMLACGRGAPHDAVLSVPKMVAGHFLAASDDAFIQEMSQGAVDIKATTANYEQRKARVAARWRLGGAFASMCEAGEPIEEPGRVYSDNPRGWPHRMARPSAEPLPCPLATIWSDGDELWGRESLLAWGELVEPPNEMRVVQLGPLKGAGKAAGDVIVAEQVAGQVASLDVSDLAESTAAANEEALAPTTDTVGDAPLDPAAAAAASRHIHYDVLGAESHYELLMGDELPKVLFHALGEAVAQSIA